MINSESEISKDSDSSIEQISIMTDCIDIKKKYVECDKVIDQSDSEEINQQNIHNKRNEKLSKPCQNGFCYCFTSDSDQYVRKKKQRTKLRKQCLQSSLSSKCSEENTTETSDFEKDENRFSHTTPTEQVISKKKYNFQDENRTNNYELQAKTSLDKNVNAPLIHIVQEIYKDKVISEVKINEQKMFNKEKLSSKANDNIKKSSKKKYFTEKTIKEINCDLEAEQEISAKTRYEFRQENLEKKLKEKNSRAGQLLKRRVSANFQNATKYCNTPPKKPPRRFSEHSNTLTKTSKAITDFREAEIILNNFLTERGYSLKNDEKCRKSFPFEKISKVNQRHNELKFVPSCPSLESVVETESGMESNIEWVTEIENRTLIEQDTEEIKRNVSPLNPKRIVQMGWVVPPKQDIDTVDFSSKPSREVDNFHNFAANMESKSTPVKSAEFIDINQSEVNNKAYETPKNKIKLDLSSNATLKVKESTCGFLKNSANKFVDLVSRMNNKDKFRNKLFKKDVSCQTSNLNLNNNYDHASNDFLEDAKKSLDTHPKTNLCSSLNKPAEKFDFNRKINSPKNERTSNRRLSFSPKKIMKNFSQKSSKNILEHQNKSEFYKSYQSDYNEDFSLNLMNDILLSIKAKLEASDRHAAKVFSEVGRNDALRSLQYKEDNISGSTERLSGDCLDEVTLEHVQVHNHNRYSKNQNYMNDIYSEIEEEKMIFSGSPSVRSLDEISHFYVNNDPNSEYAEVRKSTKLKSNKSTLIEDNFVNSSPKKDFQKNNKSTYIDVELTSSSHKLSCDIVNDSLCNTILQHVKGNSQSISFESENKIVEIEHVNQKPAPELSTDKFSCSESNINLFRNGINSVRVPEDCIVEDQTKTVKELVDYFEHSLYYNSTCNQDYSVSYKFPNDSTNLPHNKMSNTFQELEPVAYAEEDIYYEISGKDERSESCPLPAQNTKRKFLVGNHISFTCGSFDYHLNNSFQGKKSPKYSILKRKFRKSISRGKSILKHKFQNYSLNDTTNSTSSYDPWDQSNLGITKLFTEDDGECWRKQLEKAVFICRKLPVLQNTQEAAEAERLLLYSSLKIDKLKTVLSEKVEKPSNDYESWICIKEFKIPIQNNIEFIEFFNFFYVGVFTNGKKIISTNYAEKYDKMIMFRNCNINFENINCNTKIVCDIYVLRLRKLLSSKMTKEQVKAKMEEINGFADSDEQLLSRFKFQGSFQFFPHNFTPLKISDSCEKEFKTSDRLCLHSLKTISLSTEIDGEHSLILNYVNVTAELEIFFNKLIFEGFLNVRSTISEYNWNKYWCKIDNFKLLYWEYPQDCNDKPPIFICNLIECVNEKIEVASQEICPRPKSFCIKLINNPNLVTDIYFSADNQNDLNYWLNGLNNILSFKKTWM